MDPFAAQVLIQSGVPVIMVGGQVALNSMWLYESDLDYIHSNTSATDSTALAWTLSDYTNQETTVYKWLQYWKGLGNYLPPWPQDQQVDGMS